MAGLKDSSVVSDLDERDIDQQLPDEIAVCTLALAKPAAGPHLASCKTEASWLQDHLQRIEVLSERIPLDATTVRSYG